MAIDDLPLPVVNFLNVIGVPWPYLNEDQLSEFATLVRQFAAAVQATHQDATTSLAAIRVAYRSAASETMMNGWEPAPTGWRASPGLPKVIPGITTRTVKLCSSFL